MKKIQCELCHGVDIIKIDKDTFQCSHCGCKYTLEQAQTLISGVVEITKGNAELTRQLNNAEAQVKLQNYIEAVKIYISLTKEYPAEHIVWKKFMLFFFNEILKMKDFSIISNGGALYLYPLVPQLKAHDMPDIRDCNLYVIQNSAKTTCPPEKLDEFNVEIDDFWSKIYHDTLNGDFSFLSIYYTRDWLDVVGRFHPLMQKLVDECVAISERMNSMKIHYGFPLSPDSGKESFWSNCFADERHDSVYMIYVVGSECVCLFRNQGSDYIYKQVRFKLPFPASNNDAFYEKAKQIAEDNYMNLTVCPFCNNGRIKKGLFGKRLCNTCKTVIPPMN